MNYILQTALALFISLSIFGIIDYIGFNLTENAVIWFSFLKIKFSWRLIYRIIQFIIQGLITYFLIKIFNKISIGIAFNVLWWTFWGDMFYYLICELELLKWMNNKWPGKGSWNNDKNQITWAWWTFLGIAKQLILEHSFKMSCLLSESEIEIQLFLGLLTSVTIIFENCLH